MKQRIDHSNYEAWLLDRLEGNLTAEQERMLEAFLLAHPELRPDDEEMPAVHVSDVRLSMLDKEALKRALPPYGFVDERSVEDHLVARLEGDLDGAQLEALRRYLAEHPEHQRAEWIYAHARVSPGTGALEDKSELHRALPPDGLVTKRTLLDHLVAKLEGDLKEEQIVALDAFLAAHESAAREWKLMQRTRVASESIVFAEKQGLKRETRVIPLFPYRVAMRWAAAAAVVALLLTMWWMVEPSAPEIANRTKDPINDQQTKVVQEKERDEPNAEDVLPSVQPEDDNLQPLAREKESPAPARVEPLPPQSPVEDRLVAEDHGTGSGKEDLPLIPVASDDHEPLAQTPSSAASNEPQAIGAPAAETRTLGEALTGVVREKVLERPSETDRPLDGDDAVAAVDRGLRALGGDKAGLAVQRDGQGRSQGFALRLGRNLAFTASR
ncbi:MAG: hypothetical protein IPM46_08500 [Flavobacteriales bacterium]|nr:hypothetical protein [Flavobacteriales bacterium]